jgi:hypothetical protein
MYLYTSASSSKICIYAVALGGFAALAQAADLDDRLKDPLPDGPITWQGITLYGTVDVRSGSTISDRAISGIST